MKCNNCNVRIAYYLDKCPLCGKKLNNQTIEEGAYNDIIENFSKRVNTIYFSKLIVKLLLASTFITMLINLLVNKRISWSLYVLFSTLYLSSFYSFIVIKSKKLSLLINIICLELLLFIIAYLTHTLSWFIYLVGPIILIVTLFVYLNVYLSKFTNILRNFSCLVIYIAFSLIVINILIKLYKTNEFGITWSIYSSIPLLIISIICVLLSFNKKIVNEVEKRFFI